VTAALRYQLFGGVLGLCGLALIVIVDWRLAVGVFLMLWANNIQHRP
jgi:hypothetical protein